MELLTHGLLVLFECSNDNDDSWNVSVLHRVHGLDVERHGILEQSRERHVKTQIHQRLWMSLNKSGFVDLNASIAHEPDRADDHEGDALVPALRGQRCGLGGWSVASQDEGVAGQIIFVTRAQEGA